MNQYGYYLALAEQTVAELLAGDAHSSAAERLDQLCDDKLGSDEFYMPDLSIDWWEFLHRALTRDGDEVESYPWGHVVLGGEAIDWGPMHTAWRKSPQQVRDISAALQMLEQQDFLSRCLAIDCLINDENVTAEHADALWEDLQAVIAFYQHAAATGLAVLFVFQGDDEPGDEAADEAQFNYPLLFRDFGFYPVGRKPPDEAIEARLSPGRIVGEYIVTAIFLLGGLALLAFVFLKLPSPLHLLAAASVVLGMIAIIYLGTCDSSRWIVLAGQRLLSKNLYTGRVVERSIADIQSVETVYAKARQMEATIVEAIFGRVRGVEVRFRRGFHPLRIMRADPKMIHAEELIEAILYRMGEQSPLETEVIDLEGTPLVERTYRQGELTSKPKFSLLTSGIGGAFVAFGLFFGTVIGCVGGQRSERLEIIKQPPQKMTLDALIQNGPGANRHVTITDFDPGSYYATTEHGVWTGVYTPLFPKGKPRDEIRSVFISTTIGDEMELKRVLQPGEFTGVCSDELRTSWGLVLGPNLVKENNNLPLNAAWEIHDMRQPDNPEVLIYLAGGFFVAAILQALGILWRAIRP